MIETIVMDRLLKDLLTDAVGRAYAGSVPEDVTAQVAVWNHLSAESVPIQEGAEYHLFEFVTEVTIYPDEAERYQAPMEAMAAFDTALVGDGDTNHAVTHGSREYVLTSDRMSMATHGSEVMRGVERHFARAVFHTWLGRT